MGADAYPAEEPQAQVDQAQADDAWNGFSLPSEYKFVYANGQLEVSPVHSHEELAEHAGVDGDHKGPFATGYVSVQNGNANWNVTSNVSLQALFRVLKDYSKNVGWRWGGMTDVEGQPISDDFAPKKAKYIEDTETGQRIRFVEQGSIAWVHESSEEVDAALREAGYKLAEYPGGTNMDPDQSNPFQDQDAPTGDSNMFETPADERQPSGVWKCPGCGLLLPNWHEYVQHRMHEEPIGDEPQYDGKFPLPDMGATFPTHFTEMQPSTQPISAKVYVSYQYGDPIGFVRIDDESKVTEAKGQWRHALAKVVRYTAQEPKDTLADPIPFIYDVDKDSIYCGNPGERTSDVELPGKFTPGGIIEGFYEPGGKVIIRTMTNMPYTVRHMIELWYYEHPEFTVKSVHLQDAEGKDTKLAAQDIGGYISSMVAADPIAHTAATALMRAGGSVYGVGGAVRDAVMGKSPKDIDLMVQGLPPELVRKTLEKLPGRVDLTGKDFGVFRYRHKGADVEIALPRRERSTGVGHQDFDVQADHLMTPEEDLGRRDFTANAMAVNLANGALIDPFGGANDIRAGVLRATHPNALAEDPLRVLRGVVAHAKHGLTPDDETMAQMAQNSPSLTHLPPERLHAELDKLIGAKHPAEGVQLAHDTGVLQHILPEVHDAFGFDQRNPHHTYDLGSHLLHVLDGVAAETNDPDVRLAALLHDIGKPASQWIGEDGVGHYYRGPNGEGANHDEVGAEQAGVRLNALRYPNDRISRVSELVRHHMFPAFSSPKGARKFLANVGPHADDLLTLRQADMYGKGTDEYQDTKTPVHMMRNYIDQVRSAGDATDRSALAINGRDLIGLGLTPGPQFSQILNTLTERAIEDPSINDRETLLGMAQGMAHG